MKVVRSVLTPNGRQTIQVDLTPKKQESKSEENIKANTEPVEVKEEEVKSADQLTIEGMDLDELKVYAKQFGIKAGNRGAEKARAYILEKLGELVL